MAELDENLDLLDLDEDNDLDALQPHDPFATSVRPKRPWLLFGAAFLVIALATYIIIRAVGTDTGSSMTIDLDTPAEVVIETPADTIVVPEPARQPKTVDSKPQVEKPAPVQPKVEKPAVVQPSAPVREVEDRKEVKFNPMAKATAPAAKPAPAPKVAQPSGSWYVQFGSYANRAAAENAQRKIAAQHSNLFAGKQFVILAAVLPNGTTTHRLRIAFANSADANGFCRNAKSDGLDCYVAR